VGFWGRKIQYFQFTVLAFGLSSARYLFTELYKPLVKEWRCNGIPIVVFLDDGLGGGANNITAKIHSLKLYKVHCDLLRFGFLINEDKSQWEPSQAITWLGVVLDTKQGIVSATNQRMTKLKSLINSMLQCKSREVKAKDLALLIALIISLAVCFGNVTRIMTRSSYEVLNGKVSWYSNVKLTDLAMQEILVWKHNAQFVNGRPAWDTEIKPTKIVYSDASDRACGSFVQSEGKLFQQNWSPEESAKSSTWRELKAVQLALESFFNELSGQQVAWFTDNANVVTIVNQGNKVKDLQTLALAIFTTCLSLNISVEMKWIPRDINVKADYLSRIVDFDDYSLNDDVFAKLDSKWGPHSVDRFACNYNAKLACFNTRFFQPSAEVVDAITQDWGVDNNWLVPPVCLVDKVIAHLRACKAAGTLVVPMWKSSYFWTLLCADGVHWSSVVHDWLVLLQSESLFVRGKAKNRLYGTKSLSFRVVALRVCFHVPGRGRLSGF